MRNRKDFKHQDTQRGPLRPIMRAVVGNMPMVQALDLRLQYGPPALHPVDEDEPVQCKWPQPGLYPRLRRAFDVVVALLALTVFAVCLPLLAVLIRLDSRGPVFYRQERIGINRRRGRLPGWGGADQRKVLYPGRPFHIWKLRTMRIDAEREGPRWAARNDSRITRVGKVLRKMRIDEVPQFVNVLRGEMSLIGPRPERLYFVRKLEQEVTNYRDRLLVMPGITGLAQVRNGYDDGIESVRRKVALDRQYIRSSGPRTDLKILLHTVLVVLKGEGAR